MNWLWVCRRNYIVYGGSYQTKNYSLEQTDLHAEYNTFLISGALGSGIAAIMHLGCIIFGASWYRFFGAGEKMARMAEAGSITPTLITSGIFLVLTFWSYCAFAGAGLMPKPPLLRVLLSGITIVYLSRAFLFPLLMKSIPGNSIIFWISSSSICMILGVTHLIGIKQAWASL